MGVGSWNPFQRKTKGLALCWIDNTLATTDLAVQDQGISSHGGDLIFDEYPGLNTSSDEWLSWDFNLSNWRTVTHIYVGEFANQLSGNCFTPCRR